MNQSKCTPHGPVQVLVQSLGRGEGLQNGVAVHQLLSDFGPDKHNGFLLEQHSFIRQTLPLIRSLGGGRVVLADPLVNNGRDLLPLLHGRPTAHKMRRRVSFKMWDNVVGVEAEVLRDVEHRREERIVLPFSLHCARFFHCQMMVEGIRSKRYTMRLWRCHGKQS